MNVIAINGSPRQKGNTALALAEVLKSLEENGIATDCIHIGGEAVRGCSGCYACMRKADRRCRFSDDCVNDCIDRMAAADGILLGAPVYYAGMAGTMKAFLDRVFFVAAANGGLFRLKAGAGVAAVRRAGSVTTVDQLNKYLTISEMIIPGSTYWPMVHGLAPGEAEQDAEGLQCMRVLGSNMAWLLKLMAHGRTAVPLPPPTAKVMTNFIR
ncbi:MAG: flavodoxin family protein [Desulfovibrio sp.]|jgi:multimeric flavodoxin WrbA|nr:flavodoxin family protein [Desulfovibrio sp.]